VGINPENSDYFFQWADFLYQLGMALSNQQLLNQARGIALQSLERSDKYPYTYMMLASIARQEKDPGAEQQWLDRALDVEPYYYMARLLRAELLINQGRTEEAKNEIKILQKQKAETDAILASESWRLKPFQLVLLQLPDSEFKAVENKLSGVKK
jgi:tetratricopeptide (TPR) repeat protein